MQSSDAVAVKQAGHRPAGRGASLSDTAVSFRTEFVDQGRQHVLRQVVDELADGSEMFPVPAASRDNDAASALYDRGRFIHEVREVVTTRHCRSLQF